MKLNSRNALGLIGIALFCGGVYFVGTHRTAANKRGELVPGMGKQAEGDLLRIAALQPKNDVVPLNARQGLEGTGTRGASFGNAELYAEFLKIPDKRLVRGVMHRYRDFFVTHGLTSARMLRVAELILAKENAIRDAQDAARGNGLTGAAISEAVAAATSSYDAKLSELLTPDQLRDLQDAPKIKMFESSIASSVGVDMELSGVPLTEEQTQQLASIWEAIQNPGINSAVYEMHNRGRNETTGMTAIHEAIVSDAAKVLSPEQLSRLKSYFVEIDAPNGGVARMVRD